MPEIFSKRRMVRRIHWSELRYLDLHQRLASVNHVVTSAASAVFNCNTHKCSIARRQERSIRSASLMLLHDGLELNKYFHSKKEISEDLSTDESGIKDVIDIPRFVKKSNWIPKPSKNTRLESVIDLNNHIISFLYIPKG
jgi:hypothetical protein